MTPCLDKNLSPVSCATSSCFWHTMLMACYSSHSSDIALFGMGEYETSFDHCGQALVFLVHVFLHSETRHALLTGVLSDFDEFCRDKHKEKACQSLQIRRIENISYDLTMKCHDSRHLQ